MNWWQGECPYSTKTREVLGNPSPPPSRFPSTLEISLRLRPREMSRVSGNLLGVGDGFPNTSLFLVEHGYNILMNNADLLTKNIWHLLEGDMVVALEDRLNSLVAELRSRMEADLAETTANADLLRHDYHWCIIVDIIVDKNVDDHDVDADDVLLKHDHDDGWKCGQW